MNLHRPSPFPQEFSMPIGSIIPFAGKIVVDFSKPANPFETNIDAYGWLVCDGSQVEQGVYPMLYAALGELYNKSGDDVTKLFRLPDYQGQFLRMVDPSAEIDPGERKLTNGTPDSGVGSKEDDAFQDHKHNYDKAVHNPGADVGAEKPKSILAYDIESTTTAIDSSDENEVRATTETRPKNFAVYYLIKAM